MPRTLALLFAAVVAAALWNLSATAQGDREERRDRERFAVTAAEDDFVMVEQTTGRSWVLAHSAEEHGGPVWLPIERIDNPDEAHDWREEQLAIAEQREHHEREGAERHERDERENARKGRINSLLKLVSVKQAEASIQLEGLKSKYDSGHPRVVASRDTLELLEKALVELQQQLQSQEAPHHDHKHQSRDNTEQFREALEQFQSAIEAQRELLEQSLENDGELRTSVKRELLPLLLEEQLLLQTHGPKHPKVVEIRKKLKIMRVFLDEQQETSEEQEEESKD